MSFTIQKASQAGLDLVLFLYIRYHVLQVNISFVNTGNSLAGIIGGIVVGPILDLFFRRRFKLLLVLLLLGACSAFSWFTLSLPTPFTSLSNLFF